MVKTMILKASLVVLGRAQKTGALLGDNLVSSFVNACFSVTEPQLKGDGGFCQTCRERHSCCRATCVWSTFMSGALARGRCHWMATNAEQMPSHMETPSLIQWGSI